MKSLVRINSSLKNREQALKNNLKKRKKFKEKKKLKKDRSIWQVDKKNGKNKRHDKTFCF